MVATVSQRGQVTIPKTVSQKHGLAAGCGVDLLDLDGTIMVVPKETAESVDRM